MLFAFELTDIHEAKMLETQTVWCHEHACVVIAAGAYAAIIIAVLFVPLIYLTVYTMGMCLLLSRCMSYTFLALVLHSSALCLTCAKHAIRMYCARMHA